MGSGSGRASRIGMPSGLIFGGRVSGGRLSKQAPHTKFPVHSRFNAECLFLKPHRSQIAQALLMDSPAFFVYRFRMAKRENKLIICRVDGCKSPIFARALCAAHYMRMRRHGSVDHKLAMFRRRVSHPLYAKHKSAKKYGLAPEWETFESFVEGVGTPPHPACALRKKFPGEPLGPDNFRWIAKRTNAEKLEINRRGQSRRYYGKVISGEPVWTDKARNGYFIKKYGITLEQYEAMLAEQGGVCAICLKDDTLKRLAVDHCHSLGTVRGLLCQSCNLSIGRMGDDPDQLRRAAAYLLRQA